MLFLSICFHVWITIYQKDLPYFEKNVYNNVIYLMGLIGFVEKFVNTMLVKVNSINAFNQHWNIISSNFHISIIQRLLNSHLSPNIVWKIRQILNDGRLAMFYAKDFSPNRRMLVWK